MALFKQPCHLGCLQSRSRLSTARLPGSQVGHNCGKATRSDNEIQRIKSAAGNPYNILRTFCICWEIWRQAFIPIVFILFASIFVFPLSILPMLIFFVFSVPLSLLLLFHWLPDPYCITVLQGVTYHHCLKERMNHLPLVGCRPIEPTVRELQQNVRKNISTYSNG